MRHLLRDLVLLDEITNVLFPGVRMWFLERQLLARLEASGLKGQGGCAFATLVQSWQSLSGLSCDCLGSASSLGSSLPLLAEAMEACIVALGALGAFLVDRIANFGGSNILWIL
eukprot:s4767_g10.t1